MDARRHAPVSLSDQQLTALTSISQQAEIIKEAAFDTLRPAMQRLQFDIKHALPTDHDNDYDFSHRGQGFMAMRENLNLYLSIKDDPTKQKPSYSSFNRFCRCISRANDEFIPCIQRIKGVLQQEANCDLPERDEMLAAANTILDSWAIAYPLTQEHGFDDPNRGKSDRKGGVASR